VSESTKKWNAADSPVRSSEAWIARSPAKTRSTGSSQIGMTIAVSGSAGSSLRAAPSVRVMANLSRRKSRRKKPKSAVQNPIEIQPKSAPKQIAIASSSGLLPCCGSTSTMKPPAMMLGIQTRIASSVRRRRAAHVHGR